jgi:hypothetical protein
MLFNIIFGADDFAGVEYPFAIEGIVKVLAHSSEGNMGLGLGTTFIGAEGG